MPITPSIFPRCAWTERPGGRLAHRGDRCTAVGAVNCISEFHGYALQDIRPAYAGVPRANVGCGDVDHQTQRKPRSAMHSARNVASSPLVSSVARIATDFVAASMGGSTRFLGDRLLYIRRLGRQFMRSSATSTLRAFGWGLDLCGPEDAVDQQPAEILAGKIMVKVPQRRPERSPTASSFQRPADNLVDAIDFHRQERTGLFREPQVEVKLVADLPFFPAACDRMFAIISEFIKFYLIICHCFLSRVDQIPYWIYSSLHKDILIGLSKKLELESF